MDILPSFFKNMLSSGILISFLLNFYIKVWIINAVIQTYWRWEIATNFPGANGSMFCWIGNLAEILIAIFFILLSKRGGVLRTIFINCLIFKLIVIVGIDVVLMYTLWMLSVLFTDNNLIFMVIILICSMWLKTL